MNNPTIVSAALSDKELQDSINRMVANFDKGLQDMLEHSNEYVGKIQESLQKIGNTNFGAKGSNDGGVAKQTKAQEEFTESVKRSTNEIKKHGKESEMTFDQIANALSQARRTVSDFNTKRASGILPSSDDYKRYEQALARIVEYNDKLKQSALGMADANQKWFGKFSSKRIDEMFFPKDSGQLAAMNKYYADLEKNSQQAAQSAQRYTEEIRKQAQAIRESKQWKETGTYSYQIGDATYYISKKQGEIEAQLVRHKEQQVNYQKDYLTAGMAVEQNTKQQASTEEKLVQAEQQRLGIEEQIAKVRKAYTSPTTISFAEPTTNMLRKFIASKAGVDMKDVKMFDETTASASKLQGALKQLQTAYSNMTAEERNSPFGQSLIRRFQELQREAQKTQQQLSRPTSLKQVMGYSEKTLDDIAYKMRQLSSYRMGLDVNKQADEMARVGFEYDKLQKKMNEMLGKNQQMIASNTALGRSWNYMKNRLAFYFTVGASTQFVKNLIEIRSQYEMNERALGILINSAERGSQIFQELSHQALVSPYTLIELSSAAKQLTAYDIAAKDVVDTTNRLADMASAVGIPIERLTYALGQVKAYGYLNSRDQRMFANAGIPLAKQLADYYTEIEGRLVSTADVYDRIKKKAVDYADVVQVINRMTDEGGKFYDFQEKMAETLKVQLANLNLAWNNMLNDMGKSNQSILSGGIGGLKELFLHWKDIEKIITDVAIAAGSFIATNMLLNKVLGKGVITAIKSAQMWNYESGAVYRNILSKKTLTKEQAMLLVALNKNNAMLKGTIANMGLLSIKEIEAATKMSALTVSWKLFTTSLELAVGAIAKIGRALAAIAPQVAIFAAITAITDLYMTIQGRNDAIKEFNDTIKRNAEESAKSIRETLDALDFDDATKLSTEQQGKAWEKLREQIEMSAASSQHFLANLMSIDDMGERVNSAMELLEKIAGVHEMMVRLGEDGVLITQDFKVLGVGADGLAKDIEDFNAAMKVANQQTAELAGKTGEVENTLRTWVKWIYDLHDAQLVHILPSFLDPMEWMRPDEGNDVVATYEEMMFEIGKTAEDLKKKLDSEYVTDPLMIREAMEKTLAAAGYTGQQLVTARIGLERKMRELYQSELSSMSEEERKTWDNSFGYRRAAVEDFLKFARSMDSKLFSDLTEEDVKNGTWLTEERQKRLDELLEKYKSVNALAYQDLEDYVGKANGLSVYIPVVFTLKKDISDIQKDFMSRTGFLPSSSEFSDYAKNAKSVSDIIKSARDSEKKAKKEIAEINAALQKEDTEQLRNEKKKQEAALNTAKAIREAYNAPEEEKSKGGKGSKKDILGDALAKEVQLIGEIQKRYKEYQQIGVNSQDAIRLATDEYGNTLKRTNTILGKYGISTKDSSELAAMDIRDVRDYYKSLLEMAKSTGNAKGIEAIEKALANINVEITKLDYKKITDGLNNELGKLKDEYELAVELDANPEMGNLFADWMGIDMSTLPHTAEEYAKRMTKALNKYLADEKSGIEIGSLLALTDDDLRMFQQRVDNKELNQVWVDNIVKNTKEARNALKKENSDIAKEWDSLVQKYSEYEYKIAQVQRNANKERKAFALKYGSNAQKERALVLTTEIDAEKDQEKKQELVNQLKQLLAEIAGDNDSKLKIKIAIDNKELEEGARIAFEEFQKSPEWIIATGDLAGMTHNALGMLIDDIEKYKKSAKNLSPKKIKEINRALISLYKQQRQNNPFKAMAVAMREAKERASVLQDEIDKYSDELDNLSKEQAKNYSDDRAKKIDELIKKIKKLKDEQKELTKLDPSTVIEGLQGLVGISKQVADSFTEMFDAIGGGEDLKDISRQVNGVFTVLDKTLSTASTGAQIGGKWGAIVGGVIGLISGLGSVFGGGKDSITEAMEQSEREVKRLENAYKHLEVAIEEAYGAAKWGAEQAAIANKKLQLAELKRQLALERSRDSKDRDEGKINDLMGQIEDLKIEIEKSIKDITNDLLGISSVGNAAEELVSSMIDAFRKGEDYMLHYEQTFEEMIDNMVMKAIVGRVIGDRLQSMWDRIDEEAKKRGEPYQKQIEELTQKRQMVEGMVEMTNSSSWSVLGLDKVYLEKYGKTFKEFAEDALARIEEQIKDAEKAYSEAIAPTPQDVQSVVGDYEGWRDGVKQEFDAMMEAFGIKFGDRADTKQLSSLQQGLQSMSESTAESLEAYMNGVSQQVYLHSDLLTQIRDAVVGMDMDVQVATQAQMLLQLQQSYAVQMAIQGILEGVLTPSGRAFSVELLS